MDLVIKCDHFASNVTLLRKCYSSKRFAVFGLIGVLGVLAFVFSAVSPDDDEIQQESFQGNKKREYVVQHWKSILSIRGTLITPVHCAILPGTFSSFGCSEIRRISASDVKPRVMVFCSRIGGRSPPTRAS